MKYLKKFNKNESNFITYDSMETEDLEEMLHWSRIEYNELQAKIRLITNELTNRKEKSDENYSDSFPKSIFDLNKEQLNWVFENNNRITAKRYNISSKYISQSAGVSTNGFNQDTNQFRFSLYCGYLEDIDNNPNEFDNLVKNYIFLGDNLEKSNWNIGRSQDVTVSVKFGISYINRDNYNDSFYYVSEDEIYFLNDDYSFIKRFDHGNGGMKGLMRYIKSNDVDD